MRDDLVQQLVSAANGCAMPDDVQDVVEAVLACGLVVPTSDVLGLADDIDPGQSGASVVANKLRALTQQEPR